MAEVPAVGRIMLRNASYMLTKLPITGAKGPDDISPTQQDSSTDITVAKDEVAVI